MSCSDTSRFAFRYTIPTPDEATACKPTPTARVDAVVIHLSEELRARYEDEALACECIGLTKHEQRAVHDAFRTRGWVVHFEVGAWPECYSLRVWLSAQRK